MGAAHFVLGSVSVIYVVGRVGHRHVGQLVAEQHLVIFGFGGPGSCGQSARQSRCGGQSGERAAPGDATGLAGAGGGVCGVVVIATRGGISTGVVSGANGADNHSCNCDSLKCNLRWHPYVFVRVYK